jgi:hypothetical protein
MGFTMGRIRDEFERLRQSEMRSLEQAAEEGETWFGSDLQLLTDLSFDHYARAFRRVLTTRIPPWPQELDKRLRRNKAIRYICRQHDERTFGFFCEDPRSLIRLACDVSDASVTVMQDVSALIAAGYYNDGEQICDSKRLQLTRSYPENSSRIVLTEGSSDAGILRDAIRVLYPHLADFYSFLDFESTRSQGGAGHLAAMTKAFAAAGVTNRVVTLFDNDTAGRDAMRSLHGALPPNIVILSYPAMSFLESYPTVGPGGLSMLNVNGLAAGLELYAGRESLTAADGTLLPVQWRGFNEALGQYHGEVLHKNDIQKRRRAKLTDCLADRSRIGAYDWTGLHAILQALFGAFG